MYIASQLDYHNKLKMSTKKKSCNLSEALEFVLDSDSEYCDELSSDEESEEETDACYRVSLNFIDDEATDCVVSL